MAVQVGLKVVFGIPTVQKPIVGLPADVDKIKIRFRRGSLASLFFRTPEGVTQSYLRDDGETWVPFPLGHNRTVLLAPAPRP